MTDPAWLEALGEPVLPADVRAHIGLSRVDERLAIVTLARPEKRNALGLASWQRLLEVFEGLREAVGLRAVVVRGAGSEAFGAGADIAEFPEKRMTIESAVVYNGAISAALAAVARVPVPVIAMVRGLAVGGGCELASACDVRIASADARFGIPIGRLGVTLGHTEAKAMVSLIGRANLKRLLFEGELIGADEALRIGLVQVCVPPAELEPRTAAMVDAIVSGSPVTMRAAKLVADMCDRELTSADAEVLLRMTLDAYEGPHLREGVTAFLERRPPDFAGIPEVRHGRA